MVCFDTQLQRSCFLLDRKPPDDLSLHLGVHTRHSIVPEEILFGRIHPAMAYSFTVCLGLWPFKTSSSIVNLIDSSSLWLCVMSGPAGQRAESLWFIIHFITNLLWYSPTCASIKIN